MLATAVTSYVVYRTGLTLGYTWRTSIVLALIFSFCTVGQPNWISTEPDFFIDACNRHVIHMQAQP